ncbi:MAG: hypothetical protein D6772_04680, partial [Bacteroidetes bacterium]
IAKVVTKKRVKKIEIFDEHSLRNKNIKFNEFYEDITSGLYKNDRDAAQKLYGCTPKDAKYRQLKSRFRKRLLNTLFFLDVNKPSTSNYDQAHFTCHKEWTLVKILQHNGAHQAAITQAKSILTTAQKFQISEIVVNCARLLREYAAKADKAKDFEHYDKLLKEYSNRLESEIRAEELYQRVIIDYHRPLDADNDLMDRIATYGNTLLSLSEIYPSPLININMFLVWAMNYEINRQYSALIEVCDRAEKYLEEHPDAYQEERLITFFTKKMSAYLHLGDYLKGRVNAEQCLNKFPEGSRPWFNFMEYYLLLALHTEHYTQAMAIYNRTVGHQKFRKLEQDTREKWQLFEASLQFALYHSPYRKKLSPTNRREPFDEDKFSTQVFHFGSKKKILQFHFLALKCCFLIQKRQLIAARDVVDDLQKLANRSLDKKAHVRPINFVRLLLQLRKANFVIDETRNVDKYLGVIEAHPFTYRGVLSQLEALPLEQLWKLLASRLG